MQSILETYKIFKKDTITSADAILKSEQPFSECYSTIKKKNHQHFRDYLQFNFFGLKNTK